MAAVGGRAELEATGGLTLDVGAEVRRDRRRLPLGRRADPLLADPGHRARPPTAARVMLRTRLMTVLLCIDIGNTNTVLATFEGEKLVHSWRVKTDARSTADELGLMFRGLLAGDAVEITGVAACSTVPAALRSLRTMLDRYYPAVPECDRRAGRADRRAAGDRQPEGGRRRPGGQHARRVHPLRRTVHCGRLRHDHQLRRDQRAGRVPRRRVRARHRDLLRRAGRPGRPAAQGGAGQAPLGDRQEHGGVPAVRACTSASPARWTASSSG